MDEPGPFDRLLRAEPLQGRDRTATLIVVASIVFGLILLILVLPPVSIFGGGGSSVPSGPVVARERTDVPSLPAQYEAVSGFYDLISKDPVHGPARLTLTLTDTVREGEALTLLTYQDGRWTRAGDASVVGGGKVASVEVKSLPSNVLVARQAGETKGAVMGVLPPDGQLDQQGLDALSAVAVAGYAAASDASVSGDPALPAGVDKPLQAIIAAPDADAINTIVSSADLRAAHVQAIATLARDHSFAGVVLDYRRLDRSRAADFLSFVRDLSTALHGEGRTLTLMLPTPVRNGTEWDTGGFDWHALGDLVDSFQLAPDVEPDVYYDRMDGALSYLTSVVAARKLLLTIETASHERAPDGDHSLTLTAALTIASTPALPSGPVAPGASLQLSAPNLSSPAGLHWDDASRAVTMTYTGGGGERTIWLANVFSQSFRLDLANRRHLGGVVIDNVSQREGAADIWPAVRQYAQQGAITLVKPNGLLLQPQWQASGGTFDTDRGASVTWHAPDQPGDYTITLIASDGLVRVGQQIAVTVAAAR